MNISFHRRTDLALAALRTLADAESIVSRTDLATRIDTTSSFLPQVLSPLAEAGWVVSTRGPGGGYQLTEAAAEVRILDVVEAIEGPSATGRCVLRDDSCPGAAECPVHNVWMEARRVLLEGFDQVRVIQPTMQGAHP
jgi:Rrf2 family protein